MRNSKSWQGFCEVRPYSRWRARKFNPRQGMCGFSAQTGLQATV